MAVRLEDKNRKYKRFRQSAKEKAQLARAGLQHVLSSNVSAIGEEGTNLIVRFHGGATYSYRGKANLLDAMLNSNSKGSFVWKNLIRKNVPYRKVASLRLKSDAQFTDRDLQATAQRPKEETLATLINVVALQKLGIIATPDVVSSILATTAI